MSTTYLRFGRQSPEAELATISFSREMGFTSAEFLRILPAALSDHEASISDHEVQVQLDGGRLQVRISDQKYRKIASISLPYLEVDFSFSGLEQNRVDEFMRFFDLRYQRGGG